MNLGILYGGNSAEREVSLSTGEAVYDAIHNDYETQLILLDGDIREITGILSRFDLIFLALHGGDGENGSIQHFLEDQHIRYTGSGPGPSAGAMDKIYSKTLAVKHHIPTPGWFEIPVSEKGFDLPAFPDVEFPVIVKPNDEGSTFGLTRVDHLSRLSEAVANSARYSSRVLIEEYIPGRELTVGILGDESLPIVEIVPQHDVFDYDCKYTRGLSNYYCPAEIPPEVTGRIQQAAGKIFNLLGCRHYGRVDFRLNSRNEFFFLELNTLPGFTGTSLLPKSAVQIGLSYRDLVRKVISYALGEI